MKKIIFALYQVFNISSTVSSLNDGGLGDRFRSGSNMAMCDELRNGIRECSSNRMNKTFLRCLLQKVTGISERPIFQLSTQDCFVNTKHPRTRENNMTRFKSQQKGTVKMHKKPDCRRNGYKTVRVGKERIHVKLHREERTWDDAVEICHSEGALIAMPNTEEKNNALMRLNKYHLLKRYQDFWIGLIDIGENNTFVWLDGSPLSYTNWMPGEPSHVRSGRNEDCAVAVKSRKGSFGVLSCLWNDVECTYERAFFCQC